MVVTIESAQHVRRPVNEAEAYTTIAPLHDPIDHVWQYIVKKPRSPPHARNTAERQ
jgi:hypothetical protein